MKTLTDELDKLRGNICHDCKKKFVPGSVSDPASSYGRNAVTPSTSAIDNTSSSNSATDSSIPVISFTDFERTPGATSDAPITDSIGKSTPISFESEPYSEPPEFSVEYNPEVKRTLALHLEHVFVHEYPAYCANISPDGQGMAVGFEDSGATIITDMKTKSNVRSVSRCMIVGALD